MSSAGNRGIISNNQGSSNWKFGSGSGNNNGGDNAAAANDGSTAQRRRSSAAASAQKFAKLHNQKRNSQDTSADARRASFAEQSKAPGFLGGMWQSWTKGTGK